MGTKNLASKDSKLYLGHFERWLTFWISGSILIGIVLGNYIPELFIFLSKIEYGQVNFVVALFIWLMIYPMMVKVNFGSLTKITKQPNGLILSTLINWLIKPFTMAALGLFFFNIVFSGLVKPSDAKEYISGLVILGAAPCTAMVFVWSDLARGDPNYTLIQVSLNDIIMVFAFAPIVAFLLGVTDVHVPWITLFSSVGIYVVVPLIAGVTTQKILIKSNATTLSNFEQKFKPISMCGLLLIVILLFGFQGEVILGQPLIILLIAVPILIQSYGIFLIAYGSAWSFKIPFKISAPCALISASNFFELAVAVAISVFGLHSGAVLATVVGVLVEVPVMLSLVRISKVTKKYFKMQ